MARRLSAIDKDKRRTLISLESRAAMALKAHRKICGDCHPEDTWPRRACAKGWELAKASHRAANNLSVFQAGVPDDQLQGQMPLW